MEPVQDSSPTTAAGRAQAAHGAEHQRLQAAAGPGAAWRLWGPYMAGRQWGTVREDYSATGDAWRAFGFEQAHLRAYRWGEDGIAGLTDRYGFCNVAVALWNGHDDRLKERLFGLTNSQGNHGEDAKEYWWHLDATPTHSYASMLYRYPHAAFPYEDLIAENARRGRDEPEYELRDTGVLDDDAFFDVVTTHAKAGERDVVITITATNHGRKAAPLHIVPQIWFRNTWAWGNDDRVPVIVDAGQGSDAYLTLRHDWLGQYQVHAWRSGDVVPRVLLCDNETNTRDLYGDEAGMRSAYPKDGINRAVVHSDHSGVNPAGVGTKAALHYEFAAIAPGESVTVTLRMRKHGEPPVQGSADVREAADAVVGQRRTECEEFYDSVIGEAASDDERLVARRAFAGLLWCKQLYRYDVATWLRGDLSPPAPPPERLAPEPGGRNTAWKHLSLADVMSMPDEWEYPWFATWDVAFHCVALARVDPDFAKEQLLLLCREWAQHPSGALPAYEWNFSDVNPPVHAWAAWQVYLLDGAHDKAFLTRIATKLLTNFTWWLAAKDPDGSNLFEGGFLGLDNISVFDRSHDVPHGWRLEQSDATSWMAFFGLSMLRITTELARTQPGWDEAATLFLERFLSIAEAMESFGSQNVSLWDDHDGFFYDVLTDTEGHTQTLRIRSLVGIVPLFAVALSPDWVRSELPNFVARREWLHRHRPGLMNACLTSADEPGGPVTYTLVSRERIERILERVFDAGEFLSPHGVRSLSAAYREPHVVPVGVKSLSIQYVPGVSDSGLFGGNSNWRGPVWFPLNVLLADALHEMAVGALGDVDIECPQGSGCRVPLDEAASELERRLVALFLPGPGGKRPSTPRDHGDGPLWDHPTFSEYFDGDTGEGLGASHQTGWTALVAHIICGGRHRRGL